MLARLRALIKQADPDVVEEWKWDVPVWSHDGLICTGEAYKKVVKMTFEGAALAGHRVSLTRASRQYQAGHRLSRGRQDRREGVAGLIAPP
jgi:hypothetical protein